MNESSPLLVQHSQPDPNANRRAQPGRCDDPPAPYREVKTMPVLLEFISVLIPYKKMIRVFPGGKSALDSVCLEGGGMWHDGHLVRLGAMSQMDIMFIEEELKSWGLRPKRDFGFAVPWVELNPEGFETACAALRGMADTPLVGAHNFEDFLQGRLKATRRRATAIVRRGSQVLLVRDRGATSYSLPGGRIEAQEVALAAAIRELYEELNMRSQGGRRKPECDYAGSVSHHLACELESTDQPSITTRELDDFIWWDQKEDIPRYPHVDAILHKRSASSSTPHAY